MPKTPTPDPSSKQRGQRTAATAPRASRVVKMAAAPVPATVTPPVAPRSGSAPVTAAPPPTVGVLAVTPPSAPKRVASLEFATAAQKARDKVVRKGGNGTVDLPWGKPASAGDKLPEFKSREQFGLWSADVRVLLAVTEVVSRLVLVPIAGNQNAKVGVRRANDVASIEKLLDVTRPHGDSVFDINKNNKGVGSVIEEGNSKQRQDEADMVLAANGDLKSLFFAAMNLGEDDVARTQQLVQAVIEVTGVIIHWLKDHLVVPRPYELTGLVTAIDPMLDHPGHSSYPAGHAAQAAAVAVVLERVAAHRFANASGALSELAAEVGLSRVIAGLHYKLDIEAGIAVGAAIGGFLEVAAKADGRATTWQSLEVPQSQTSRIAPVTAALAAFPKLRQLWEDATEELK